jgi:3-deoxy-D-manno-octulosonic-acid transferase
LGIFFYNAFLILYRAGIAIASAWSPKARKWLAGRKNIFEKIQDAIDAGDKDSKFIWVHCSSLGEFEQGRPIIERIKMQGTRHKIVVTFFSPSGYEVKKNYPSVDYVSYIPMDSKKNAAKFLDLINPHLVIFIKYDYWYYYLDEVKTRNINCLLISAVFRPDQAFFKWYGGLQRKMLRCFSEIFVQNEQSKTLLETISLKNCIVSGDTRFDTVAEIADNFRDIPLVEEFTSKRKCIVAGSTWKDDEEYLQKLLAQLPGDNIKLIIAPHEIHKRHIDELQTLFPASVKLSEFTATADQARILIIDNIGMLSRLYKYAYITYVGGGFTEDGVHNVLEAAVYAKPVVFGKNYQKYEEAIQLVESEGAKSFSNQDELFQIIFTLLNDEDDYRQTCRASEKYVRENKGATQKIMRYMEEKRLLTN